MKNRRIITHSSGGFVLDVQMTQEEAETLISCLKKIMTDTITAPVKGKTVSFNAESISMSPVESFVISIFHGKINRVKLYYNARIKYKNVVLLMLHIVESGKHLNPDGTIVSGSHWHVYREGFDSRYAYPADDVLSDDFVENAILFLRKFNIINIPSINEQLEI